MSSPNYRIQMSYFHNLSLWERNSSKMHSSRTSENLSLKSCLLNNWVYSWCKSFAFQCLLPWQIEKKEESNIPLQFRLQNKLNTWTNSYFESPRISLLKKLSHTVYETQKISQSEGFLLYFKIVLKHFLMQCELSSN